jgi:hypothetical protein
LRAFDAVADVKQRIKTLLASGVLALAHFGIAAAGPLEDGWIAYDHGDYATAMQIWRPLAEQGDAFAQDDLGLMYALGHGVPQDFAQAVVWFRKAADQGDADAQFNLGMAYFRGEGLPQDYAQAAAWYRKAADQGHADAQFVLGGKYEKGEGVPQDYAHAAAWYRKAAEQGLATAQFSLGLMYEKGEGVPQDYAQAHMWHNLAASRAKTAEDRKFFGVSQARRPMTPARALRACRSKTLSGTRSGRFQDRRPLRSRAAAGWCMNSSYEARGRPRRGRPFLSARDSQRRR